MYLGCAFALNHKGMPIFSESDQVDFLHRQILTSRNIRGGRFVTLVLGGLNYQIEHHLFPSMPRSSLRSAQPIVRAFCAHHDIAYVESGPLESYRHIVRYLRIVGRSSEAAYEKMAS